MSLGWSTKTESTEDIDTVFKRAENHMYRAKLYQSSGFRGETIQALMVALCEKNPREEQHSKRVSALCKRLAKEVGLSDQEVNELGIVGLFHDIGKIAIDEQILNKAGVLTENEWKEMIRHPEVGYRLLGAVPDLTDIATYVLAHHERWDGSGYPKGIKGKDIPLQSRIVAVVDAYDAMVSERPYKKSLTKGQAIEELRNNAGTQFDPDIVKVFVEAMSRGKAAVSM
jgi:HD-GYP domain-containing protein (c-di-GMP phosphodiesterase class II)